MIDVKQKYFKKIVKILKKYFHSEKIFFYGSRVKGKSRPYSDLDIAVSSDNKIQLKKLAFLEEEFSESDIPFTIDLSDMSRMLPSFRERIEKEGVLIQLD